jgi:large subunit ribosomal protein L30
MAKKKEQQPKMLRVKLVRSMIGYQRDQRDTVRSLGIHRMQQTVEVPDNPVMRGMINKIIHLLSVEEVE